MGGFQVYFCRMDAYKLEDNESYQDMLDSVIHTDGIAKLSGLKIIKQIDSISRLKTNACYSF